MQRNIFLYPSFLIAFTGLLLFQACAQIKAGTNVQAYYVQENPGTQMVDESGQPLSAPVRLTRVLYLKAPASAPLQIDSIVYGKSVFAATAFAEQETTVRIGKLKTTNREVVLKAEAGNRWWRIEVTPSEADISSSLPAKQIQLIGSLNGRKTRWSAAGEQELVAASRY